MAWWMAFPHSVEGFHRSMDGLPPLDGGLPPLDGWPSTARCIASTPPNSRNMDHLPLLSAFIGRLHAIRCALDYDNQTLAIAQRQVSRAAWEATMRAWRLTVAS
jgi:hypothetical protein